MFDRHMRSYLQQCSEPLPSDVVRTNEITFQYKKRNSIQTFDAPINILGITRGTTLLPLTSQQMSPHGTIFVPKVVPGKKKFPKASHKMFPLGIVFVLGATLGKEQFPDASQKMSP
jgi:hypothetical protein